MGEARFRRRQQEQIDQKVRDMGGEPLAAGRVLALLFSEGQMFIGEWDEEKGELHVPGITMQVQAQTPHGVQVSSVVQIMGDIEMLYTDPGAWGPIVKGSKIERAYYEARAKSVGLVMPPPTGTPSDGSGTPGTS